MPTDLHSDCVTYSGTKHIRSHRLLNNLIIKKKKIIFHIKTKFRLLFFTIYFTVDNLWKKVFVFSYIFGGK